MSIYTYIIIKLIEKTYLINAFKTTNWISWTKCTCGSNICMRIFSGIIYNETLIHRIKKNDVTVCNSELHATLYSAVDKNEPRRSSIHGQGNMFLI